MKKSKKKISEPKTETPVQAPQNLAECEPKAEPSIKPSPKPKFQLKLLAVGILLILAIYLAFYFMTPHFISGAEITQDEFKTVFASTNDVYIVMDVRNAVNSTDRSSILQCGVDFAASNGMGGKNVTPLSFASDGCVTPNGYDTVENCLSMLNDGVTIYVASGTNPPKYYTNGMVVNVGTNYTQGVCGINKVSPST